MNAMINDAHGEALRQAGVQGGNCLGVELRFAWCGGALIRKTGEERSASRHGSGENTGGTK
jgi:hypothetical protein